MTNAIRNGIESIVSRQLLSVARWHWAFRCGDVAESIFNATWVFCSSFGECVATEGVKRLKYTPLLIESESSQTTMLKMLADDYIIYVIVCKYHAVFRGNNEPHIMQKMKSKVSIFVVDTFIWQFMSRTEARHTAFCWHEHNGSWFSLFPLLLFHFNRLEQHILCVGVMFWFNSAKKNVWLHVDTRKECCNFPALILGVMPHFRLLLGCLVLLASFTFLSFYTWILILCNGLCIWSLLSFYFCIFVSNLHDILFYYSS